MLAAEEVASLLPLLLPEAPFADCCIQRPHHIKAGRPPDKMSPVAFHHNAAAPPNLFLKTMGSTIAAIKQSNVELLLGIMQAALSADYGSQSSMTNFATHAPRFA